MRWPVMLYLLILGITGLRTGEADEPGYRSAAAGTMATCATPPQHPPAPYPAPAPIKPEKDSIANRIDHLRKAARHLRAAGWNSLADHILESSQFPTAGESPQILLHVKVLELDQRTLHDLGWDSSKTPLLRERQTLSRLLAALRADGLVRVLAEPTLVTIAGRSAYFHSGGDVPIWEISEDGKLVQRYKHYGTYANFLPRLADELQLLLDVRLEVSKLDRSRTVIVGGKENPLICRKTMKAPLEMKFGETFAMSCPSLADTDKVTDSASVVVVVLVTPEAVTPMAAMQPSDCRQH